MCRKLISYLWNDRLLVNSYSKTIPYRSATILIKSQTSENNLSTSNKQHKQT